MLYATVFVIILWVIFLFVMVDIRYTDLKALQKINNFILVDQKTRGMNDSKKFDAVDVIFILLAMLMILCVILVMSLFLTELY
ncbi:hypothetical protein AB1D63_004722 [Escherichia coli]|nr:hypothetical protein [Escherichia coli]EGF1765499.1 hypothetical protein [Escherichia coli]MCN7210906.1 hypothetical protein [Escherichia coli]